MIWATVSSRSCFCWLYRASPSLAAKNIINLISVLTIWWCPCVVFSPSPTPRVYSNLCPLSRWCHPTTSSSIIPFSSCLQFFPASGSFQMSWLFVKGGQSIGASASASVLPMNIQDWFPLGLTGLISLKFKGLSRVFSNTTIQKYHFSAQLSL